MRAPVTVLVHGNGRLDFDGMLLLEQTVAEGAKRPATRRWRIRADGPGRYSGTLSNAGPVTGMASGSRLHLHFVMKGGLATDQDLDLAADGQSAHNVMTVRKMGVRVAVLDETIRRVGP